MGIRYQILHRITNVHPITFLEVVYMLAIYNLKFAKYI